MKNTIYGKLQVGSGQDCRDLFPFENFVHVAARFSRVRDLWKSACVYYLLFLAWKSSSGVFAKWIKPFKRFVISKLANSGRSRISNLHKDDDVPILRNERNRNDKCKS